jgi:hypothetical protein
VKVEAQNKRFGSARCWVFDKGEDTTLAAVQHSTLMALGGDRWENDSSTGISSPRSASASSRPRRDCARGA